MKTGRRLVVGGMMALLMTGMPTAGSRVQPPATVEPAWQTPSERAARGLLLRGRSVSSALDKGTTYHALEQTAWRVTTTFEDAVTVSERVGPDEIVTEVLDRAGTPRARLRARRQWLDFREAGHRTIRLQTPTGLVPTLDWAGRQAYLLLRDRAAERGSVVLVEGNVVRPRGRPDLPRELDQHILSIVTEWPDGVTATARWRRPGKDFVPAESPTSSFTTFLHANGTEIGWLRWIAEARIVSWSFPGSMGWVNDERLKEYGGWPFVPDMAWANIQAFAWYQLPRRSVAGRDRAASVLASVRALFAPVVQAQNPPNGCTLPSGEAAAWLDGSVFRVCCDAHDLCYWAYGCNQASWWWPFGYGWQCTACNLGAVHCFAYGGAFPYPFHQLP